MAPPGGDESVPNIDQAARIVIVMGVAGSGKTTIGTTLAKRLDWIFFDGDEFHPRGNLEKMKGGSALTDDDRSPWLDALHALIRELTRKGKSAVIACSALKRSYRERLAGGLKEVVFVYLKGGYDLARQRVTSRSDHFLAPDLVRSQFEILEEPEGVLTIDATQDPEMTADQIEDELGLRSQ